MSCDNIFIQWFLCVDHFWVTLLAKVIPFAQIFLCFAAKTWRVVPFIHTYYFVVVIFTTQNTKRDIGCVLNTEQLRCACGPRGDRKGG